MMEGRNEDLPRASPAASLPAPEFEQQPPVDWRGATIVHPRLALHRYVEEHAAERPEALAVTFEAGHLSYDELNRRANRLAHYLIGRGVKAGTRVAVCVEPSFDIASCILAIFKAGGTHVPVDPSYPRDRLEVILDDVQPGMVLAQTRAVGNLPLPRAPILYLDRERDVLDALPDHNPDVAVGLEQPAFIVYTSGTTGKPKGVVMSHANLIQYVLSARDRYGFGPSEVIPAVARFTFSITMFEVLVPLVVGGRVIVLEREAVLDLKRFVRTLQEATAVHVSPSLWRKVLTYLRERAAGPDLFPYLRHVSSGGDVVSADLVEGLKGTFPRAEIFVIYGCSEIACMGCTYFAPRDRTATRNRVGKPFENVSVRLYGPDGQLVPAGVIGEIYFGGAGVALGYLDRDDLTKERFVNLDGERFYRTGDLGRGDDEGNVEILGRSDFQIKLRGIRIELGDIETTLRQAPGVEEAVVAGRDLGGDDKSLVAYVVPAQGQSLDIRAIRQFLQTKLPDYMVPFAYVVLEALPVNLNNKLDRAALPAPTVADLGRLRSFDPPRNDRERKLVEIWENVLGIRPIGVKDNFFEIGGDSLQSVSLMVEIERELGRPLALSTVITDPTIEKMAALLGPDLGPGQPSQSGIEDPRTPMVLLRAGGSAPPVFFVHDGEGEVLPYRNLALRIHPAHPVYGIRPVGDHQHPMMHTRISDLVETYTAEIRRIQPKGPYLLGGLCIGGFIAFEIARKLKNEGEQIGAVALIDAAHVTARGKSLGARRLRSFSGLIGAGRLPGGDRGQVGQLVRRAIEKVSNLIRYEIRTQIEGRRNRLKMRLFRFCLDRGLPLPPVVREIPVRVILRFAEKEYLVPAPYPGEVALFRATHKDAAFDGTLIDDTPYVDLFVEPLLGWKDKVGRLEVHDLSGGHSSMLMEPNVETLALKFGDYLDRALGAVQSRTDVERIDQRRAPTEHAA